MSSVHETCRRTFNVNRAKRVIVTAKTRNGDSVLVEVPDPPVVRERRPSRLGPARKEFYVAHGRPPDGWELRAMLGVRNP